MKGVLVPAVQRDIVTMNLVQEIGISDSKVEIIMGSIIAVMSGKGGVGKSLVSGLVAIAL